MKLLTTILIVYSLLIGNVFGAVISDDTVKIGKPGSTANKEITLGTNQKIRSNQTTGQLEYTNDGGALYKKIGSGSGTGGSSGIMLNENDSFEDGLTPGWTSSGGTFSQQTYPNSSTDDTKYAQFVATTSGQYFETTAKVIPTNFSAGCQADFKKLNTTAANLFKIDVIDGSANILATANIGLLTWQKLPTLSFPCPSTGTTVKIRVTSLAAGTILADRGYIGSNQNLVYTSQAKILVDVNASAASCSQAVPNTTGSWQDFSTTAACPAWTVNQAPSNLDVTDTDRIDRLTFTNLQKGSYRVTAIVNVGSDTAADNSWLRLTDGTKNTVGSYFNQANTINMTLVETFKYTATQASVVFKLQGQFTTSGRNTRINANANPYGISWKVEYFPDGEDVAISNEQSSWLIDANIGGGNPVLGGTTSTYTEITDANLDLVINTSKGSAPAEIACPSGTASTGLTCASSESVGIAFIPPSSGAYEVCFAFSTNSTNGDVPVYQIIETPNNSTTVLQEGGERIQSGFSISSGNTYFPHKLCGSFNFSDTSKRTLRVMYEKSTANTSNLVGDRAGTAGQRDIKVTVKPLLSGFNRPTLTGDTVTTPGAQKPVIYSASFSATGVKTTDYGSWVNATNLVITSTSNFRIPIVAGKFGAKPNCSCNTETTVTNAQDLCSVSSVTLNQNEVSVNTYSNAGTNFAYNFNIICHGIAP